MEEPERKTFSRTYYNSSSNGAAPEPVRESFQDNRPVCRFFTAGICTRGVDCSFSHELPVCQHFLKNSCIYGDECWKLHPETEKTESKAKLGKKVVPSKHSDKVTKHGDTSKAGYKATKQGENASHEGVPCPFFEEGYCKYGNMCFNVHKKVKKEKKPKPTEEQHKVICDHFQKGVCAYGDTCWKVHEQAHVTQEVVKEVKKEVLIDMKEDAPICEHFQKGNCAYGETCYKKHVKMPLFKDPYGPITCEVTEKNIQNSQYTMEDLFLSDSEPEDHILVPKHPVYPRLSKKKKPRASPVNLFEVLGTPTQDNYSETSNTSSDDTEDEDVVTRQEKTVKKSPVVIISNAEKKRLKKEAKKKQAELISKKKIDDLKESGNKDFQLGKYSSAVKLYTEAINLCGPNNPIPAIYNNRCAAFIQLERFKSALKDGRKVIDFEPNNIKAHIRVLKCCLALGKVDEGRKSADQIVESDKEVEAMKTDLENVDKLHSEALELATKKSFQLAIEKINQGLKISPYCSQFLTVKAKFYALEKNIGGARRALDKLDMKDQNVKTSLYHFVNGLCFYYEDDMERAISGFGEAKKELSEAGEWHDRALAMHNSYVSGNRVVKVGGSYPSALECIDKGLALDKGNSAYMAKLFFTRALLNTKYERLDSALTDCTNCIKYQPRHVKALSKRGSLHLQLEKYAEAVEDLTEAYRIKPTPEIFRTLEDAKRRKTKAENRKPSHYQILGVDKKASIEEIKKAYRSKAREFHPDKHANASKDDQDKMEAKMKEIAAANQCLSDTAK